MENSVLEENMTDELKNLRIRLEDIMVTRRGTKLVNLRSFNCNNVKCMTQNVDEILIYILTKDLMETRDLIRSTSILVSKLVGKK